MGVDDDGIEGEVNEKTPFVEFAVAALCGMGCSESSFRLLFLVSVCAQPSLELELAVC